MNWWINTNLTRLVISGQRISTFIWQFLKFMFWIWLSYACWKQLLVWNSIFYHPCNSSWCNLPISRAFGLNSLLLASWISDMKKQNKSITTKSIRQYLTNTVPSLNSWNCLATLQAPVVQRLDNAIQWINRSPVDKC